ncbi:hypothetical protein ASD19_06700 [Microbacterium sp. Root53]|uniref:aggregation-promoting factor C-terminal-like domain-containing protein n=1 Tax=Microbacterium sp. Root53 TaxID=1736553 RepID=UPI0006F8E622|nr:hypothetical protein [Microbacterium sp. Root53]KQY98524.1 hypothetical protein ASD19_06700 [Microbacterium sp. Root53]
MSHNTPETPLLTPFPRPNHLSLLRRERRARQRRRLLGVAVAAGLMLSGTAAVAATAPPPGARTVAEPTRGADDATAAAVAEAALDRAEKALSQAHAEADTSKLRAKLDELSDYEKLPAVVISGEVVETEHATQDLVAQTAALVREDEEEARRAAEEAARKAEEEAARKAEEERQAAEALAAANTPAGAQATAQRMAAEVYGWGAGEFSCLVSLWNKESGWNYQAMNPSSGAYGIPQSLPGDKMATVASDWATNATTQITWGLDYISRAYGSPCAAWGHSQAVNWY